MGALGTLLGWSWPVLVALGGAVLLCGLCVGDRGSRPSEPREARRAKAEALMIMYFHVVNCLWLLGWFGNVLSCLGCMLLCIFVLESFSRCGRPRARFVELIRCSRPWACFGELKRRFPFSAAQVWDVLVPVLGSKIIKIHQKIDAQNDRFRLPNRPKIAPKPEQLKTESAV